MFDGVKCVKDEPIFSICISLWCKESPFVCEKNCECKNGHQGCGLKNIEQLKEDIKAIKKFQFLIVYSPVLKAESIHIIGRFAVQTEAPPNNQRFALTYDHIPPNSYEDISFRLTKIRGCVGVGIFNREILLKNQFRYIPDAKYLNHGAHMILSNNRLYSNSREQQNGKSLDKFNIKEKDVIKVKCGGGRLTFSVGGLSESVQLQIKGKDMHFGVYLYEQQDQVQIINSWVCGQ